MSMSYKHVVVAVDGSKEAEWAFKKSVGIAKRNQAVLHLVRVIDFRSVQTKEFYNRKALDQTLESARILVEQYRLQAQDAGVEEVQSVVEQGSPKYLIPRDIASRVGADLIVCGATGHGPIERFVIGSVSQSIVRNSPCDVLVVRTEEHIEANQ